MVTCVQRDIQLQSYMLKATCGDLLDVGGGGGEWSAPLLALRGRVDVARLGRAPLAAERPLGVV